jgi:L-fuconolactonase
MIVDAQIHIWQAETPEHPWRVGAEPHLPQPFGYEDLARAMKLAGVDRAVLVPPAWQGDRNDFALEGAVKHPNRFAVMGRIAPDQSQSASLLPSWTRQPGMLGIRLSFQKAHNSHLMRDGAVDWIWPAAERYGIPLMVFAPAHSARIREIAVNHPRLKLIVDHMGLLREQNEDAAAAMERTIALADCPNVHVKVTSVPLYSSEPYPYRNLHAALRRMIGAFGPRRAFWGTDITRIWSRASYRQCVTLFTEELDFLSADDLDWVMGRGLMECLGWRPAG